MRNPAMIQELEYGFDDFERSSEELPTPLSKIDPYAFRDRSTVQYRTFTAMVLSSIERRRNNTRNVQPWNRKTEIVLSYFPSRKLTSGYGRCCVHLHDSHLADASPRRCQIQAIAFDSVLLPAIVRLCYYNVSHPLISMPLSQANAIRLH